MNKYDSQRHSTQTITFLEDPDPNSSVDKLKSPKKENVNAPILVHIDSVPCKLAHRARTASSITPNKGT